MTIYNEDGTEFVGGPTKPGALMLLKGTSGVGKGTRVRYLLEWFKTQEEPKYLWFREPKRGKLTQLGTLFEKAGVLFLGRMTPHKYIPDLYSWYSLDYINRVYATANETSALLKELLQKYNVVAEGNPGLASFRYRANYVFLDLAADGYFCRYYAYRDDPEEYLKRVVERTGKQPKSMSAWENNRSFIGQYKLDLEELVGTSRNTNIALRLFDEPVEVFGTDLLSYLGGYDLASYSRFCYEKDFHRPDVSSS